MVAVNTKTRKLTEITSPVVYRCTDKVTGEIFYAVPSDSGNGLYKVTFNEVTRRYEDTCPAKGDCKHCRAVREVVLAKAEIAKQGNTSPATTEYRVSRVDGIVTKWYPEYNSHGTWYRFPQPDGNQAVSFVVEGRAEQWIAERIASVEERKAERKMDAFKRGMDEQYASDPRTELAKQIEARETADSNLRAYYNGL